MRGEDFSSLLAAAEAEEERRWVVFTSLREERRSRPVDSTRAVRAAALEA